MSNPEFSLMIGSAVVAVLIVALLTRQAMRRRAKQHHKAGAE